MAFFILAIWVKFGETLQGVHTMLFRTTASFLWLAGVALLQACTFISNASVYEGIRGADKTKTTGTTQTPAALPSYDRYEKERDALKK
jgi:hypothetical protein